MPRHWRDAAVSLAADIKAQRDSTKHTDSCQEVSMDVHGRKRIPFHSVLRKRPVFREASPPSAAAESVRAVGRHRVRRRRGNAGVDAAHGDHLSSWDWQDRPVPWDYDNPADYWRELRNYMEILLTEGADGKH